MGRARRSASTLVRRSLRFLAMTAMAAMMVMLLPPVRNTVLPVWPRIWRDVSSADVLRMLSTIHQLTPLPLPEKIECSAFVGEGVASVESDDHGGSGAESRLVEYLLQLVSERQKGPQPLDVLPDPHRYFQLPPGSIRAEVAKIRQLAQQAYNRSWTQHRRWEAWLNQSQARWAKFHMFRPLLEPSDAAASVYQLFVFDLVCRAAGIQYMIQAGSLLGAYRYQGLIPWDDDIDLSIDVAQADLAFRVLSCIPGYTLRVVHQPSGAQWKLFRTVGPREDGPPRQASSEVGGHPYNGPPASPRREGSTATAAGDGQDPHHVGFPFLDIFIHAHDRRYVWALAVFTFTTDLTMRMEDVVPLLTLPFEGGRLPVPGGSERVLDGIYDLDQCASPSLDHKKGVTYNITVVRCAELREIYPMVNG